jgi:NADH dehydrogenase
MPTAFVAGATGYTGQRLVRQLAQHPTWKARPHARKAGVLDGAVVCDPCDVDALADGMRGCDAVVQLIGTVRKNFAEGDYEAIDYGTTVALGDAAKRAGVPRILLLSSVGAAEGWNKYLAVKRKTEKWVEASGLEYTLVRPSFIVGPGRAAGKIAGAFVSFLPRYRAIDVEDLARVFVRCLERRDEVKNRIVEGKAIWDLLK